MKKVIDEINRFNDERDWHKFHTPENLAKSICIESSELLECFQWNNEFDMNDVKEELADVMCYCLMMAESLNLDIKKIILDKIEKNKIKYPVEKSFGNSAKYNKL